MITIVLLDEVVDDEDKENEGNKMIDLHFEAMEEGKEKETKEDVVDDVRLADVLQLIIEGVVIEVEVLKVVVDGCGCSSRLIKDAFQYNLLCR